MQIPSNLPYAVGALLTLLGWAAAARALVALAKRLGSVAASERAAAAKALASSAALAAVLLLVGSVIVRAAGGAAPGAPDLGPGRPAPGVFELPIAWFVMPWTAWIAAAALVMAAVRAVQALGAIARPERRARAVAAALWLLAAAAFVLLYRHDPASKVTILRGAIPLSPANLLAVVLFAGLAVAAMALAARSLAARGWAKGLATQAALLSGCFVFGLPFAFLLVTSFKEDRDMANKNGIVWIPRVQREIPYVNPDDPVFAAKYEGRDVEATILERLPNGRARMEVFKPLSIRGVTFESSTEGLVSKPQPAKIVDVLWDGKPARGFVAENKASGDATVQILSPPELRGKRRDFSPGATEPVRDVGLRTANYSEALAYLPPETNYGLVYLKNTLFLVLAGVAGTLLSSSIVAYAFSRLRFPGKGALFTVLLATMMLPGAVTLLPQFLIFKSLGWIDTLYPLWVPAFFGSAFNVFLLRQFFMQIPMELEDAAKIDGCGYLKTFWSIMMPQIKPALTVIAIWTFMGAWNNFMGPLIYINSPDKMTLAYALQLFQGDRSSEPGLLMAFSTMTLAPVLALFFFTQRYFIEGVTLSGLGGR